ncbi:hypothetical protein C2857_003573 [Epichloe festucae Fl1]|uniref:BZIP domain-containing protein n=1 Tax=Epichloe festucae (strain Fl1) TaxID=877507 RepID=A0A7S9KUS6_EPIFF|nr:hypothetical protein C2857_003573 [Epichloe festucae Fl1]
MAIASRLLLRPEMNIVADADVGPAERFRREQKRIQNRNAQRTYRNNHKQRLIKTFEMAMIPVNGLDQQQQQQQQQHESDGIQESSPDNGYASIPIQTRSSLEPSSIDSASLWDEPVASYVVPVGGGTALSRAVKQGYKDIVQFLISHGADLLTQDADGNTILHLAARNSNAAMMGILLQHIADPNLRDSNGRTPLFTAVQSGNDGVVSLLIQAGADVLTRDNAGDTALHVAVDSGSLRLVQLLVAHGAPTNI